MNTITDRVDINRVLMQMRELKAQAQSGAPQLDLGMGAVQGKGFEAGTPAVNLVNPLGNSDKTSFSNLLKSAVNSVNDTQKKAGELALAYETGDQNVDITQVMIQIQKASVSFEAMTQVRNRLVTAYQDIMNMPI